MSTPPYVPNPADAEEELTVRGHAVDTGARARFGRVSASTLLIKIFAAICRAQAATLGVNIQSLQVVQMNLAVGGTSTLGQQLLTQIDSTVGAATRAERTLELLADQLRQTAAEYDDMERDAANLFPLSSSYWDAHNHFVDMTTGLWGGVVNAPFWVFPIGMPRMPGPGDYIRELAKILPDSIPGAAEFREMVGPLLELELPDANYRHIFLVILPYVAAQLIKHGEGALDAGLSMAVVRELALAFGYSRTQEGVRNFTLMVGGQLQRDAEVSVKQIAPPGTHPALGIDTVPRSASNSLEELVRPYEEISGLDGAVVRVDRIINASGQVEWQIIIPGTNGKPGEDSKPWNWADAAPAVAGLPTPGVAGIMDAMRQAGIGADEKVVLVGHSQGGALAVNIANQAAASGEFNVEGVLTLGSPISNLPIPAKTHVLSLEHNGDTVPSLDGGHNAVGPNQITISRTLDEANDPAAAAGSGQRHAHDFPMYIITAALADARVDLETLHAKEQLLGTVGSGSQATSSYFQVTVEE